MKLPARIRGDKDVQRNFDYLASRAKYSFAGSVAGAGTIKQGVDFTVAHTVGTGVYVITFRRPFGVPPVVVPAPGPTGTDARVNVDPTTTSVTILTYNSSTLAGGDADFSFTVTESS